MRVHDIQMMTEEYIYSVFCRCIYVSEYVMTEECIYSVFCSCIYVSEYMMGCWSESSSSELKARAADEKLMVSVSSPSPPGSSNDRVRLLVRDHQQSSRTGGKPHPAAQGGESSSWVSISWQLAAGSAALRMTGSSLSRWQGLMFHLEQQRLVWILSWPFTCASEGCISSTSSVETAEAMMKLHIFEIFMLTLK